MLNLASSVAPLEECDEWEKLSNFQILKVKLVLVLSAVSWKWFDLFSPLEIILSHLCPTMPDKFWYVKIPDCNAQTLLSCTCNKPVNLHFTSPLAMNYSDVDSPSRYSKHVCSVASLVSVYRPAPTCVCRSAALRFKMEIKNVNAASSPPAKGVKPTSEFPLLMNSCI